MHFQRHIVEHASQRSHALSACIRSGQWTIKFLPFRWRHFLHLLSFPVRDLMVSAHDVAAYILSKCGEMSAMKLQKLVYYSQAWSLVWDDAVLFNDPIEAWANGPVVRSLYDRHRGAFRVKTWPIGKPSKLNPKQRATVDAILAFYGEKTSQWLSELTHQERPWRDARKGLGPSERGSNKITSAAMVEYYSSL